MPGGLRAGSYLPAPASAATGIAPSGGAVTDRDGEEAVSTVLHALSTPYVGGTILLGAGLTVLYLIFLVRHIGHLLAEVALTVSGYLRPRPDPGMEMTLRTAFAELDRELAAVLGDRGAPWPRQFAEPPA